MTTFQNLLSEDDLYYLQTHPAVLAAKAKLDARRTGMLYLSVPATDSIRAALSSLDILVEDSVPLRWIKGDTAPHIDSVVSSNPSHFDNTFLLYLNDSPGELFVESNTYPIQTNTGVVFEEGLRHGTRDTQGVPRLLLGPMNELAQPVGSLIYYYPSLEDALNSTNVLYYDNDFEVGYPGATITSWRITQNSTGTFSPNVVYTNGTFLDPQGNYYLYPAIPCFKEGTNILCQVNGVETYVAVEKLQKGTLVKTSLSGFKPVVLLGKSILQNPGDEERTENRLYQCSPREYPELAEDLFITGCHSILVPLLTEKERAATIENLGKVFVTEKKYRLMACLDERAKPWASEGAYTIWHFALEHEDTGMNYGVYANGGLLVETCSIRFLKTKSNMELV